MIQIYYSDVKCIQRCRVVYEFYVVLNREY
jgi:hypothetical protein